MKAVEWRKDIGSTALYGAAEWAAGRPSSAIDILWPRRTSLSPYYNDILARALRAVGRTKEADAIARDLAKHGYAHPGFLAFWRDSLPGGASTREAQK